MAGARRGVSLIETVLSVMILGGAFASVLTTVASSRASHAAAAERQMALALAEDLMAEVQAITTYKEPGLAFGPELGEKTGDRSAFDDIDDFHGWTSTPPTDSGGRAIPGADGYTRSVIVQYVDPGDPLTKVENDLGLMRITIEVKRNSKTLASLIGFRSDVWRAPQESY